MTEAVGFLAAIISMIFWGSFLVPMKRIKNYDPFFFQLLMCAAIFVTSVAISLFYGAFSFSYLGLISGLVWSLANILSILAVRSSGLSRAAPIWMGVGIFMSFAWGMLFFNEPLSSISFGVLGIILLIAGISLISSTSESRKSSAKGMLLAVITGVLGGSYLVPLKMATTNPETFLLPLATGILAGGIIISLIKKPKIERRIILPGVLSGALWNIANFSSFFAILGLGMAVGFPLTQMSLFVSILWGIFYFREMTEKNKIILLIVGSVVLFAGAVILALSL